MVWRPTSFQFVAFNAPVAGLQPNDLYQRITGTFPQSFSSTVLTVGSTATADGVVAGLSVQMVSQPGRFDLVVRANEPSPQHSPFTPLPSDLVVNELVLGWLTSDTSPITEADRLSVVCTAHSEVSSIADGVADLAQRTGLPIEQSFTSDFLVQLNRRKQLSKPAEWEMNRLVQFSMIALRTFAIQSGTSPLGATGGENYFEQMQADVNTVVRPGNTLDRESIRAVWQALAEEAKRIVEAGRLDSLWA